MMKTMCFPGYHHNGFVATHALGRMMYGSTLLVPMNQRVLKKQSKERNESGHKLSTTHRVLIVVITRRTHCFHNCVYITLILLL